ncbi:MAG: hypothetical protein ACXWTP_00315 [Methylosarcina sp.]
MSEKTRRITAINKKNNMNGKQIKREEIREVELLPSSPDNGHLINQTIVQILIEKDNPEEIKELMRAELDYNRERLSIIREHAEKHPDSIEDRKSRCFRRMQYGFLMCFMPISLAAIYFMPTAIALALSSIQMIIIAGLIINGRERDGDSETIIKMLEKTIRSQS